MENTTYCMSILPKIMEFQSCSKYYKNIYEN